MLSKTSTETSVAACTFVIDVEDMDLDHMIHTLELLRTTVRMFEEMEAWSGGLTEDSSTLDQRVRYVSYNSPLQITIEFSHALEAAQQGALFVSPVALVASILGLATKWAEVRERIARSSTVVSKERLEKAAFDLMRERLQLIAPQPVPEEVVRAQDVFDSAELLAKVIEIKQLQ